jgi:hypothetical protein
VGLLSGSQPSQSDCRTWIEWLLPIGHSIGLVCFTVGTLGPAVLPSVQAWNLLTVGGTSVAMATLLPGAIWARKRRLITGVFAGLCLVFVNASFVMSCTYGVCLCRKYGLAGSALLYFVMVSLHERSRYGYRVAEPGQERND